MVYIASFEAGGSIFTPAGQLKRQQLHQSKKSTTRTRHILHLKGHDKEDVVKEEGRELKGSFRVDLK